MILESRSNQIAFLAEHAQNKFSVSEEDAAIYAPIAYVLDLPDSVIPPETKEETARYYLWDQPLPYEVKKLLSLKYNMFEGARTWNWRYLEGEDLCTWGKSHPIDEIAASHLLANESLVIEDLKSIFWEGAYKGYVRKSDSFDMRLEMAKSTFIDNLEDSQLMETLAFFKGVNMNASLIIDRLRVIHDLDESIPDEWIEHMLT